MQIEEIQSESRWQRMARPVPVAPLVFFRWAFGLLMFGASIRFLLKGWVEELYLEPKFHFKYYGWEWVEVGPDWVVYGAVVLSALSALFIAFGRWYRVSTLVFLISFVYIELLDKTTYLNHYYFITHAALFLVLAPLGRESVKKGKGLGLIQGFYYYYLLFLVGSVYFFGGVAKLNYDWLVLAQPLRIWLSSNSDFPVLGTVLDDRWFAYAVSWGAALFDLSMPLVLVFARRRWMLVGSMVLIWGFHIFTSVFFYIGMFPYFMMVFAWVLWPAEYHLRWQAAWKRRFEKGEAEVESDAKEAEKSSIIAGAKWHVYFLAGAVVFQLFMPFRHWLYPRHLLWREDVYRYGWNIMLQEKTGYINFTVRNNKLAREFTVEPSQYLTPLQVKQMSTQPDMILEFAHYIGKEYGYPKEDMSIFADSYVAINGKGSARYIKPDFDLLTVHDGYAPYDFIMPYPY